MTTCPICLEVVLHAPYDALWLHNGVCLVAFKRNSFGDIATVLVCMECEDAARAFLTLSPIEFSVHCHKTGMSYHINHHPSYGEEGANLKRGVLG